MKRFTWALLAVLAAVVLFAGCGGGSSSSSKGDAVKVPDVAGKPLPQARKTLEGLGFKVKADAPDSTFGVVDESNWVVKSQDKTGSAEKGATVTLTVERPDAESADTTRATGDASATTKPVDWTARVQDAVMDPNSQAHVVSAEVQGDRLVITTSWRKGFDTDENNERNGVGVCTYVYGSVWNQDVQVNGSDGAPLAETIPLPNGAGKMCRAESNISFGDRAGG